MSAPESTTRPAHSHSVVDAAGFADLGYKPMDRTHAEFDAILSNLLRPGLVLDLVSLEHLHCHLVSHFKEEDDWMMETDFPPRDCHMKEHAAVLLSSEEVLGMARQGDFSAAPRFVSELARWFPGHLDYLDSALAAWMCKRAYGGKPVVLHRVRRTSDSQHHPH